MGGARGTCHAGVVVDAAKGLNPHTPETVLMRAIGLGTTEEHRMEYVSRKVKSATSSSTLLAPVLVLVVVAAHRTCDPRRRLCVALHTTGAVRANGVHAMFPILDNIGGGVVWRG